MFRLSNNLVGLLNAIVFVLSIPILGAGIWLAARGSTDCERYLEGPAIAFGVILMAVSLAGFIGACCRVNWLLWLYLLAMFVLIVIIFGFTIFAFVVTNKGAGQAVSGRGYKDYRLGDYSNWLQNRVGNAGNWAKIESCLQDGKVCKKLQEQNETLDQFIKSSLSPIESGCCKPPTDCNFQYENTTTWTVGTNSTLSVDPDCVLWNNNASVLCYSCSSCKAGVVATLKDDWKKLAIVNIIFLIFIIIVYSVGCCAFRNNRRDNSYNNQGYSGYK